MTYKRTIIAAGMLLLAMALTQYVSRVEEIRVHKPFSTFPKQIGEWSGKETRFEERVYDILGVDDSFLGHYFTPDKRYVQLYVGFYESQREGDIIHSPRNCMPGSGWNVSEISKEMIKDPNSGSGEAKVIKLLLQKGVEKQVVLYWFHSRGRIISSEYTQKVYLVLDSIFRHRTDGSFVRLITPVVGGNEGAAVTDLKDFAEALMPILNEHIPS